MDSSRMDSEFPMEFHTGPIAVQRTGTAIERIRGEQARLTLAHGNDEPPNGHDEYMSALAYIDYVAARLANPYAAPESFGVPPVWPGRPEDWKPDEDMRENLVRAGALIAVSLDALG